MTVVTEDMAPGDNTPVHRHPDADELIFIESGTGKVTLGDKVQLAHAGAIVFIPRDTWFGMENVGNDRLKNTAIWSVPGAEQYQRSPLVMSNWQHHPIKKYQGEDQTCEQNF
jgi:quercetin dioxygenase-like cupin family protein